MFVVLFAGILWRWELQHGGSTTHHMEKLVQPRSLPLRFMKQRPNWLWDLLRGRVRPGNRNHKHQVLKICYINTCGHQNPRTHSKLFYNYAEKTRTAMVVGDVIALLSVPIPHSKFQSMFFYIYIYIYTFIHQAQFYIGSHYSRTGNLGWIHRNYQWREGQYKRSKLRWKWNALKRKLVSKPHKTHSKLWMHEAIHDSHSLILHVVLSGVNMALLSLYHVYVYINIFIYLHKSFIRWMCLYICLSYWLWHIQIYTHVYIYIFNNQPSWQERL